MTIFGHDHGHKNYKERIWYNGSFSRLCHGEEDPKGFLFVEYDSKKPVVHFIENELAPIYRTLNLHVLFKNKEFSVEEAIKVIQSAKKKADHLKIKISKKFTSMYPAEVEILKNFFSNKKGIQVECTLLNIKNNDLLEVEGVDENNIDETFSFLLENTSLVDKIKRFIEIKHNDIQVEITESDISNAISST